MVHQPTVHVGSYPEPYPTPQPSVTDHDPSPNPDSGLNPDPKPPLHDITLLSLFYLIFPESQPVLLGIPD